MSDIILPDSHQNMSTTEVAADMVKKLVDGVPTSFQHAKSNLGFIASRQEDGDYAGFMVMIVDGPEGSDEGSFWVQDINGKPTQDIEEAKIFLIVTLDGDGQIGMDVFEMMSDTHYKDPDPYIGTMILMRETMQKLMEHIVSSVKSNIIH